MSETIEPYGFIYKTTNLLTGKIYIGKKAYAHRIKVKLSKKERKATGKKIKIVMKDSGHKDYYGSSEELQADIQRLGTTRFTREILKECPDKMSLAYWEQYYQFTEGVLFTNSYNGNIGGKFYKNKIKQ